MSSPHVFNIVLEVLVREIRQEKEINKRHPDRKRLSLFAHDITLYTENPKESTKKNLLGLINEFDNVVGYKINIDLVG